LQGDSNAAEIIANGLVVTATFCLLYYRQDSKYSAGAINHHRFLTFDLLTRQRIGIGQIGQRSLLELCRAILTLPKLLQTGWWLPLHFAFYIIATTVNFS
jgi:hypothetical protein